MHFDMKVDTLIGVVLGLSSVATFFVPLVYACREVVLYHRAPSWMTIFCIAIWLCVIPSTLPQYYALEDDHMFIRQGWHKVSIPYRNISEVKAVYETWSSAVFSADRLVITTTQGKTYVIAPKDQSKFLEELTRHDPRFGHTI